MSKRDICLWFYKNYDITTLPDDLISKERTYDHFVSFHTTTPITRCLFSRVISGLSPQVHKSKYFCGFKVKEYPETPIPQSSITNSVLISSPFVKSWIQEYYEITENDNDRIRKKDLIRHFREKNPSSTIEGYVIGRVMSYLVKCKSSQTLWKGVKLRE